MQECYDEGIFGTYYRVDSVYVNSEKQIKAVLAGHLRFEFESRLPGGMMQYVTNRGDSGFAREITFI